MQTKALTKVNQNYKIIDRFVGGMSNYTYLVEDENNNKYVYRYPGENNEKFVDYEILLKHLEEVEKLNITNELVYYNPDNGIKISKYIVGENITEDIDLKLVANCLKILHTSTLMFSKYNHLERLTEYEELAQNTSEEYFALKNWWLEVYEKELKSHIKYPTHGDSQFSNIVLTNNNDLKLLDWEFSGINDYIYDIASFGNQNFEMAKKLLIAYEQEVKLSHMQRLYGWRIFQCLQWHNVALYKHQIGLSQKLEIPFDTVAQKYLKLAEQFSNEYKEL